MILDDQPRRDGAAHLRAAPHRVGWSRRRGPARGQRRPGVVYGVPVFHPDTGQVVCGYVGRTFQPLADREQQHHDTQPWADTIAGPAYVIEAGVFTVAEIEEREAFQMRRLLPLYPYEFNLDNPHRIPIFEAREQRARRDAARGVRSQWSTPTVTQPRRAWSPWTPVRPGTPQRRRATAVSSPALTPAWSAGGQRLMWWAYSWVGLVVALTAALIVWSPVGAGTCVELGVGGATVLTSAGWVASLSHRRRRRLWRWTVGTAAAVVVTAIVWTVLSGQAVQAVSQ